VRSRRNARRSRSGHHWLAWRRGERRSWGRGDVAGSWRRGCSGGRCPRPDRSARKADESPAGRREGHDHGAPLRAARRRLHLGPFDLARVRGVIGRPVTVRRPGGCSSGRGVLVLPRPPHVAPERLAGPTPRATAVVWSLFGGTRPGLLFSTSRASARFGMQRLPRPIVAPGQRHRLAAGCRQGEHPVMRPWRVTSVPATSLLSSPSRRPQPSRTPRG